MERDYEWAAEKFWNQRQKSGEEMNRDRLFMDDQILHAHLEREISRHLDGIRTVLDAGGGTGRFSIWLAEKGYEVTHLDISEPMLTTARERARAAGVEDRITFVQKRITDLSEYAEGRFDLVISFDAPVSYTYPRHFEVIRELVRVAGKAVVLSVSSRLGSYPYWFNPASKLPFLVDETDPDPAMQCYVEMGKNRDKWEPDFTLADRALESGLTDDPDDVFAQLEQGGTPWPVTYMFRPEELESSLIEAGLAEVRLAGPGALARTLPGDVLQKLLYTDAYREPFLQRCYRYDSDRFVCGMGKDNLVGSGRKRRSEV